MSARLVERFGVGDRVRLRLGPGGEWQPATVAALAPPGLWVKTADGHPWFVTNGRHIRPAGPAGATDLSPSVARRLLALNAVFYSQEAAAFARSRRRPQPGFETLKQRLTWPVPRLLDVGCGNGRFGRYLADNALLQAYTGVDFSAELLALAAQSVDGQYLSCNLARAGALAGLDSFDRIICLAVLQHIPGRRRRERLLQAMAKRLTPEGRIVVSTWQFAANQRQRRKVRPWSLAGLSPEDVEPDDYLLSWGSADSALRYVAAIDRDELARLAAAADLALTEDFRADGREGNLNLYAILMHQ